MEAGDREALRDFDASLALQPAQHLTLLQKGKTLLRMKVRSALPHTVVMLGGRPLKRRRVRLESEILRRRRLKDSYNTHHHP